MAHIRDAASVPVRSSVYVGEGGGFIEHEHITHIRDAASIPA